MFGFLKGLGRGKDKVSKKVTIQAYDYRDGSGNRVSVPTHKRTVHKNVDDAYDNEKPVQKKATQSSKRVQKPAVSSSEVAALKALIREKDKVIAELRSSLRSSEAVVAKQADLIRNAYNQGGGLKSRQSDDVKPSSKPMLTSRTVNVGNGESYKNVTYTRADAVNARCMADIARKSGDTESAIQRERFAEMVEHVLSGGDYYWTGN